MALPNCSLMTTEEIEKRLKNFNKEEQKVFLESLELINFIEIGRDISNHKLSDKQVFVVEKLSKEFDNYKPINEIKKILEMREKIKVNIGVEFCGQPFTVVKRDGRNLDIKQNFSRGTIYQRIDISELKLLI